MHRCVSEPRAIDSSALEFFSASARSWPGRVMCVGSMPEPYSTAGTLSARRMRRAAPLPNSVRFSAAILISATGWMLLGSSGQSVSDRGDTGARHGTHQWSTLSITAWDLSPGPRRGNPQSLSHRTLAPKLSPTERATWLAVLLARFALLLGLL